jgi:hypothetical protein
MFNRNWEDFGELETIPLMIKASITRTEMSHQFHGIVAFAFTA